MQLDFAARELTIKVVYYGPALSGKTTNLQAIHRLVNSDARSRLMTLETRDDRTLFFDLLPLTITSKSGVQVRLKVFTVPGQVIHNATRRLVLQGVDGIAFVADSQRAESRANQIAFLNMRENLADNGLDPARTPIVIQFNKRDLPDIRPDDELDAMAQKGKEPVYKAIATRGVGVIETFHALLELTWARLETEHKLNEKFSISPTEFIEEIRNKLGTNASPREIQP